MKNSKVIVAVLILVGLFAVAVGVYFVFLVPQKCIIQKPTFEVNGFTVNDFAYQLQGFDLDEIAESEYDLMIIDYSIDGTAEGEFTQVDINYMKTKDKILLSYISIGEAENYRYYWNDSWDTNDDGVPDEGAPDWLDIENPEWEGNYKVHYWDSAWQQIIYGSSDSYLDKIIAAGFDGAYLDIIDAYEYYEERGRTTAQEEMINFVINLSTYAKSHKDGFLIVPQNGEELLANSSYRDAIDGIGKEDLFYIDNEKNSAEETEYSIGFLNLLKDEGKFVLVTDYPTLNSLVEEVYCSAYSHGYLAYVGPRELDVLEYHKGFLPD